MELSASGIRALGFGSTYLAPLFNIHYRGLNNYLYYFGGSLLFVIVV